MRYKRSEPLHRWLGSRALNLGVLAGAHAATGDVNGPHLTVARLVNAATAAPSYVPVLTEGLTSGRGLDRGNADLRTIKADFGRLGLTGLDLGVYNSFWQGGDRTEFPRVFMLRNALAHGNEQELQQLRSLGVRDTVSWARARVPVFNRVAKSLDRHVWDHLGTMGQTEPWE